jgi:peptidoglycan/LPS O-acetylase OafA/YrhL
MLSNNSHHVIHLKYRPDIDGLRGVAVLAVICFHYFPNLLPGGFVGVDVFYVISGYLISSIVFKNLNHESFSFVDFYNRRIRRIFPSLISVLLASFVFGWFALFTREYKELGKQIAGGAAFISNFIFWNEAGYFDTASSTKPLLHLWSLGVEEQFYFIWPILIWMFWKSRVNLLLLTSAIGIASFAVNIYTVNDDQVAAFYSPLSRFWELMVGSVLAYLSIHHSRFMKPSNANLRAIAGLIIIVIGCTFVDNKFLYPGWWALLPTIGAFLLISAPEDAWINKKILSSALLVRIGLISYPLYLWHWPLISFATILQSGTPSVTYRITLIVLSFVLAYLSYALIEKPIKKNPSQLISWGILVPTMLITGILGYNAVGRGGYEFREKAAIRSVAGGEAQKDESCSKLFEKYDLTFCRLHDANRVFNVALVGDSHANQHWPGLSNYYAKSNHNLILLGWAGAKAIYLPDSSNIYQKRFNKLLVELASNPSIETIVLSFRQPYYNDKSFEDGLKGVVNLMQKNGKKVVFILDNPALNFDPVSCVGLPPIRPILNKECTMAVTDFQPFYLPVRNRIIRTLNAIPNVMIFDTLPIICDDKICRVRRDDLILYFNSGYMSQKGDMYLFKNYKY